MDPGAPGLPNRLMGKKAKEGMIVLYMPDGGERGLIQLWWQGVRSWVEVRGRPYSQWEAGEDTPFSRLHDTMEGWHTTVLHQDSTLVILPTHPDYDRVRVFMNE